MLFSDITVIIGILYNNKKKLVVQTGDNVEVSNAISRDVFEGITMFPLGTHPNPFGDSDTVEQACKKIDSYNEENPFFMFVGTVGPHDPYTPPQEFLDLYDINDITLPSSFNDTMNDKRASLF